MGGCWPGRILATWAFELRASLFVAREQLGAGGQTCWVQERPDFLILAS